jgi:hypothetical protein
MLSLLMCICDHSRRLHSAGACFYAVDAPAASQPSCTAACAAHLACLPFLLLGKQHITLNVLLQVDYDEDKLCAEAGVLGAAAVDYQQYSQLLLQADSDNSACIIATAG